MERVSAGSELPTSLQMTMLPPPRTPARHQHLFDLMRSIRHRGHSYHSVLHGTKTQLDGAKKFGRIVGIAAANGLAQQTDGNTRAVKNTLKAPSAG
jgi:hypothetical protein